MAEKKIFLHGECVTLFFLLSLRSLNPDLQRLNEVCDKALRALHPSAKGKDRLHPDTVKAINI